MKLTRSEIEKKQKRIEEYKKQISAIRNSGQDAVRDHELGFAYNSENEIIAQQVQLYVSLIEKEERDIREAEVVEEFDMPAELVNIGDVITAVTIIDGEEPREFEFMLANERPDDYQGLVVSTASPVGAAVYGKMIGEQVQYVAPQGKFTLTIVEKSRGLKR
ncbi:MAG: GreA/GreB family elongation factor [Bacilli bacterium]|nr:GreA/GreB family elongation factor [Bacilli bacterium]